MANERMYLCCMCKSDNGVYLGKTMSDGYYRHSELETKELLEYFDKHAFCGFDIENIHYDRHYYIGYEMDKNDNINEISRGKNE